jgi:hypothetical protein
LMVLEAALPASSGEELWEIAADGAATLRGAFPSLPAGATGVQGYSSKLDGCGALVQIGYGVATFEDVIVRREVGGASELVYTETSNPLVKIHISGLVTGP